MVMERLAIKKNRKQYHGGCCYGDLLHVIMGAKYLLILLTTMPTSPIPSHLADATESYHLPSSNVNDSLFLYTANDLNGNFSYIQANNSTSTILSCNNESHLEALNS